MALIQRALVAPHLRVWVVLTEASALASLAVMPYTLSVQREGLARINEKRIAAGEPPLGPLLARTNARRVAAGKRAISLTSLLIGIYAQSHLLYGLVAWLGLHVAQDMGLGVPYLDARLHGRSRGMGSSAAIASAAAGAAAALVTLTLDRTLFRMTRQALHPRSRQGPGIWRGVIASCYGATGEEVLLRLGLQTFLAANLRRLRHEATVPPTGATMWPAIVMSSAVFGAAHLPLIRSLSRLTPAVVARTLVLNGTIGIVCGYLYWMRSLEEGMVAHGMADLVLLVGPPATTTMKDAAIARWRRQ